MNQQISKCIDQQTNSNLEQHQELARRMQQWQQQASSGQVREAWEHRLDALLAKKELTPGERIEIEMLLPKRWGK